MQSEALLSAHSGPTTDRYTDAAIKLLHTSLRAGETVRLPVTGTSMLPLLHPGDTVWIVVVDPAELQRGDLVVVRQDRRLLAHRLVAINVSGWHTKGDNNHQSDPPLTAQAIQGRIVTIERHGTLITMQRRHWQVVNRLLGALSRLELLVMSRPRLSQLLARRLPRYAAMVPFRLAIRALVAIALFVDRCS
jgi:signal peptidase I